MDNFKKGDILVGTERGKDEIGRDKAKHFIVFISGSKEIPNGVILTHTSHEDIKCNFKLNNKYKLSNSNDTRYSYFVAHLIEKVESWGPYIKIGEISIKDLNLINSHIEYLKTMTWEKYENSKINGKCSSHG